MQGKVCIVTGANRGIGKATAAGLAQLGATVVMVCRDRQRGEAAQQELIAQTGSATIDLMLCDLASQASIRQFAADFQTRYPRLDVLLHNAALNLPTRTVTADGLETMLAVNHLAPFLLTHLLLDRLRASAPARVVVVSSKGHRVGWIPFDNLQGEKFYSGWVRYPQTKLMNVLFTLELARRLAGTGITANVLDPGTVNTDFGGEHGGLARRLILVARRFAVSLEEGAQTSIYLASSPEVEGVTGQYFVDCHPAPLSRRARDMAAAQRLWRLSAELTHLEVEPL